MQRNSFFLSASVIAFALAFAACNKMDDKPNFSSSETTLEQKISENGTNPDEAIFSKTQVTNHQVTYISRVTDTERTPFLCLSKTQMVLLFY